MELLDRVRVVVALGRLAFDVYLSVLKDRGAIGSRAGFVFGHGRVHRLEPVLISSFHPSQQNTSTRRLTTPMLVSVFRRARQILVS